MADYTDKTIEELEAEREAIDKAIEAKKAEPDYEKFRAALEILYRDSFGVASQPMDFADRHHVRNLIAAYPELKKVMEPSDDDGWIPWSGGTCPVDRNVRVQVRLRSRSKYIAHAEWFFWHHTDESGDIIAYRII